jgi:hypothetical protein
MVGVKVNPVKELPPGFQVIMLKNFFSEGAMTKITNLNLC